MRWFPDPVPECFSSALALLVPGVLADHHDATVPADDLALLADFLDTWSDLHGMSWFLFDWQM